MPTRKATRRELLKLAVGAGSLALLEPLGFPWATRSARADTGLGPGSGKPTKLLTIYVAGGWVPMYLWCPLSASEILSHLPPPQTSNFNNSETCFFTPEQVTNTDGSGDALDSEGYARIRVPRTWDEAALAAGTQNVNQHKGWSWAYDGWKIWERANVVHGIDMQTADHKSAQIATLCGLAGPTFASPSMHAWVAAAMAGIYGDDRPLGSVNVGNTVTAPAAGHLPPGAAPVHINQVGDLAYFLAESKEQAWAGLRNRSDHTQSDYWGQVIDAPLPSNDMDEQVLARTKGLSGSANDALFEQIYDGYRVTSRQLAKDVVSVLQNTPGLQDSMEVPYWYNHHVYKHLFTRIGGSVFGKEYTPQFDLALKLLRSDLCSAVHVRVGERYHDDHSDGHRTHYPFVRADFEIIGRLLAYMKMVPAGNGKTLLDDTLVLITSEFGRTWPLGGSCDHWPGDSVCFAGGNTHGNRMVGGFDLSSGPPESIGFMGKPVTLLDENGDAMQRPPWSRDVVYTALHMMGIPDVFLPGGPGQIVGVQQG